MTVNLTRRLAAVAMTALLGLSACGGGDDKAAGAPSELTFSILSAEGQASAGPLWQPLLDDLSKAVGVPVKPYFGSNYTVLVEAMRGDQTQIAWFSAKPAVEAIDRADAEVIARTVNREGQDSYRSTLIVRAGSGITLAQVLACFKTVRSANHQSNAFSVASGVLDVATSNTVNTVFLKKQNPQIAAQIQDIWQSPPIPESGILVREDVDPALKEKIRSFFLTYGQGEGAEADRQRQVLAALEYSRFNAADDGYLNPIREMVADQKLAEARAKGDSGAAATAERELQRLRSLREVQP
jgi:phosphonate transport system substrate-binding protein